MAPKLIRKVPGNASVWFKRKAAEWDDDFLFLVELIAR